MELLAKLRAALGAAHVLEGADAAGYGRDWMGHYIGTPLAVLRPGDRDEVVACVKLAAEAGVPLVPIGGNTGLVGGTMTQGGLLLSLERLNKIRALRSDTRIVIAEAGVVLQRLHDAAEAEGLYFPLWFGARGSAMLGGALSTNAGGSNVLRYGSTRALCLGLEVVLADGRVLDLMSELHKDNSGYDLKQMFIGAEGTLGIITAAVMKLVPAARAHATAVVAAESLPKALGLLNSMQAVTGGRVEAFELMPRDYMQRLQQVRPDLGMPFAEIPEITLLVEAATTVPEEAIPGADGSLPLVSRLETVLGEMLEEGAIQDAVVATSEAQRRRIWERREAAAELCVGLSPSVDTDICLPVHRVQDFLAEITQRLKALDPGIGSVTVGHLGDGNLHYAVHPSRSGLEDEVLRQIESLVVALGGSFSAEHGIGLSKLASMQRLKNPVALDVMRVLKAALDPQNLLNPGKVIPPKQS